MEYNYLVLGSGIAGLTFALHASAHGTVAIITKKQRSESNTNYAQGGIAAAVGQDDSWELHLQDTLIAGAGLCYQPAVETLVKNGPRLVNWLIAMGTDFDRIIEPKETALSLGREGGHGRNRIIHSKDRTGSEIERALLRAIRSHPRIQIWEHFHALDLLMEDGVCHGALALDTATNDVLTIRAGAVMLATGGSGQVYQHTTNPPIATGDGLGMAWRAGAVIANMEFIQFHPTSLYHPEARSFLISEAVRGEGAVLKRLDGHRFMADYDSRADLAPRDIVARAIDFELKRTGDPYVLLDMTHLPAEKTRARFPTIYEQCLRFGIDITSEPIPVVPAAHYVCGGVWTDLDARTTVQNLYACGEVTCTGVHGANRLASNSLLEALVFAERAAIHAAVSLDEPAPLPPGVCQTLPQCAAERTQDEFRSLQAVRESLQKVMWERVGIARAQERLKQAMEQLCLLETQAAVPSEPSVEHSELQNLFCAARLITQSALLRKESRGLHYVLDYPETMEKPPLWTLLKKEP